jgi:hypothetical protein
MNLHVKTTDTGAIFKIFDDEENFAEITVNKDEVLFIASLLVSSLSDELKAFFLNEIYANKTN